MDILEQLELLDTLNARHARISAELKALSDGADMTPGQKVRSGNLIIALAKLDEQIAKVRAFDGSADDVGIESGDGARPASRGNAGGHSLRGAEVLRKDESFVQWSRDNGHGGREHEGLNFDKYVKGLVTGEWKDADAERKALSEGTLSAGGYLVPTPLAGNVIDLARNQSRVFQAGAQLVPMTAQTLKIARLTGEGTPAWRAENAAITPGDLTFDSVTFTARSMARLVVISRELFEDSNPAASGVIANAFAAQIALELDRAALRGSGTAPEPRGILNQSGVTLTSHGTNGSTIGSPPSAGVMGWEFLVQAAGAVENNNFTPNAQVMAPRTNQSLSLLRDTTNQYIAPPGYLNNTPRLVTKQVPTNLTVGSSSDASEVYTGQWNMLGIGIRTSFELEFLRERYADNLQVGILAHLRADVQVFQPGAFAVDLGVRS
ncbi:phage major capsid protein [Streptomyces sp. NPDC004732]|uniref:phage major capsid protein n=1 Tax=Streptomyces sp. NPDC004732 TaxID=3154290 RepID=UPI0033A627AD